MKKTEADTYQLGLRYLQDDEHKRAIELLSIAIDVDPHFVEAYGFRGMAYFTLGTYQEAMDDYNIALSLDSSLHSVYCFRATLHLMLKHYQDAVDDFTLAIELDNYFIGECAKAYWMMRKAERMILKLLRHWGCRKLRRYSMRMV